jgi:hypothetical protein
MNEDGEGASGAVAPAEAGVEIQARVEPASPAPGEPTELAYRVSDAESGEVISELPVDHERQMHLIAVSRDLEQFQHVHPEPDASGDFAVTTQFPTEGTYALFDEFVRDGRKVLDRREVEVGAGGGAASLTPDLEPKTVDGLVVSLEAPEEIRAGEEADSPTPWRRGTVPRRTTWSPTSALPPTSLSSPRIPRSSLTPTARPRPRRKGAPAGTARLKRGGTRTTVGGRPSGRRSDSTTPSRSRASTRSGPSSTTTAT